MTPRALGMPTEAASGSTNAASWLPWQGQQSAAQRIAEATLVDEARLDLTAVERFEVIP